MEDYIELGNIRGTVVAEYQKIKIESKNVEDTLDYFNSTNNVLSTLSFFNLPNKNIKWTKRILILSAILNIKTLHDIANAQSPSEAAAAVSAINLSNSFNQLQEFSAKISELQGQILKPLGSPTNKLYHAILISEKCRKQVENWLNDAEAGKKSLLEALKSIYEAKRLLKDYGEQLRTALQINHKIMKILFENKLALIATYHSVLLTAAQQTIEIQELIKVRAGIYSHLNNLASRIEKTRLNQINYQISFLKEALSHPLFASSIWTTSADIIGDNSGYYKLSFEEENFTYPGIEIDGKFKIGILTVHNYIKQGGGGSVNNAEIIFNLNREVEDPFLGIQNTSASTSIKMYYHSTTNIEGNNCGASSDFFNISSLGINLKVCENDSESFIIYGRYDSPLRIVAIEAVQKDIDPDPEPAVEKVYYVFDVIDGEGSGLYLESEIVSAVANVPTDQEFFCWDYEQDLLIDKTSSEVSFSMPQESVTLKAIFRPKRNNYELSIIDGSGSGIYPSGTEVPIEADKKQGFNFSYWSGDVSTISDCDLAYSYVIVEKNTFIQAEYAKAYTDTDGDGMDDIYENCPNDPNKVLKGECGCGIEDKDYDGDGIPDCNIRNEETGSCFISLLLFHLSLTF